MSKEEGEKKKKKLLVGVRLENEGNAIRYDFREGWLQERTTFWIQSLKKKAMEKRSGKWNDLRKASGSWVASRSDGEAGQHTSPEIS